MIEQNNSFKMKLIITLFFLIVATQFSFAQQKIIVSVSFDTVSKKENEIVYKRSQPLLVSDFKAKPENGSDAVGMAYTGFSFLFSGSTKKGITTIDLKLTVNFDRSKSWLLDKFKNKYTLRHEQGHFDITAINACALYNALKNYAFTSNFSQEITNIYREYQQLNNDMQDQYDLETNHAINKTEQQKWNDKIEALLNDTNACYP